MGETLDAETLQRALAEYPTPLERLYLPSLKLTEEAVQVLTDSPCLPGLTNLSLASSKLSETALVSLLSARRFGALTSLTLSGVPMTREAARAMASNPALRALSYLELWIPEGAEAALAELAVPGSTLTGLESLRLTGRGITAEGIRHLLTSEELPGLRTLSLMLRPEEWESLRDIPTTRLTTLSVHGNTDFYLGTAGIASLAQLPWLAALTTLTIGPNHQIGSEGTKALAASPYLSRLENLTLYHNYVGNDGVAALAASPHLAQLKTLILNSNEIDNAGMVALASSPYLTRLESLSLGSNKIGAKGVATLVASPNAATLRHLDLSGNYYIGAEGGGYILVSPHLHNLKTLHLGGAGLHEFEEEWVDQGMVIGSSPPDREAVELRARFGDLLRL
jgi:Leucine-rich repeat (LRR) protein